MDVFFISIYITLWVITFIVYQRKRRCFDAGSFILSIYLMISVFSLLLYQDDYVGLGFRDLSLFPFLLLYLLLLLGSLPVLKYDGRNKEIKKPDMTIIVVISVLFIASSLISVESTIRNFRHGITVIMTTDEGGAELYQKSVETHENIGHGGITNLFSVIITSLTNICAFFLFYLLRNFKENKRLVYGLIFSYALLIMQYISMGTRGSVVELIFLLLSSYFIFKPFYTQKVVSVVNKFLIVLLVLVSFPIVAISISRFDRAGVSGGVHSSTFSYLGQSNLNFNKYALDDNGIRYGDRVIPLFKRMVFIDNVPHNFWERRMKYPYLKVNDEVFITFVGDFLIDFGPFFGSLILIFFSLYFLRITRARGSIIGFHQLIILHLVVCNCVIGAVKLFHFSDVGGNLQLIVYFLTYIYYKNLKLSSDV